MLYNELYKTPQQVQVVQFGQSLVRRSMKRKRRRVDSEAKDDDVRLVIDITADCMTTDCHPRHLYLAGASLPLQQRPRTIHLHHRIYRHQVTYEISESTQSVVALGLPIDEICFHDSAAVAHRNSEKNGVEGSVKWDEDIRSVLLLQPASLLPAVH